MQRNSDQQEKLQQRLERLKHRVDLLEEELHLVKLIDDTEEELERLEQIHPDAYIPRSSQLFNPCGPPPRSYPTGDLAPNATPVPPTATPPRQKAGSVSHCDEFPEGSIVRFSLATTEKAPLRGKTGVVVGHSPKFVKVEREGAVHLRTPIKLTLVADSPPENERSQQRKESKKAQVPVQKRKTRRCRP